MTEFNSIFIASGSNLGDRAHNLSLAQEILQEHFNLIAASRIYESPAVDYLNQPDFYNQVLEFKVPISSPQETMDLLLQIEKNMGRNRLIPKGPRLIDLDILFWRHDKIQTESLIIPHPRLFERSFVILPLSELPGFRELKNHYEFKFHFDNSAHPLS